MPGRYTIKAELNAGPYGVDKDAGLKILVRGN
jgi:hypothetical protein